jgi:hypothetical protein
MDWTRIGSPRAIFVLLEPAVRPAGVPIPPCALLSAECVVDCKTIDAAIARQVRIALSASDMEVISNDIQFVSCLSSINSLNRLNVCQATLRGYMSGVRSLNTPNNKSDLHLAEACSNCDNQRIIRISINRLLQAPGVGPGVSPHTSESISDCLMSVSWSIVTVQWKSPEFLRFLFP